MSDVTVEVDRLATLDAYGIMDSAPEAHFDAIVEQAGAAVGTPVSMISLVDDTRQWFKAKRGVDGDGDPIAFSICAHAIQSDETFVVPDASADPRFKDFPAVQGGLGIRFYAGAPLKMRNGARLGTLCVIDVEPRADLAQEERWALEALARRTVAAFELRREMREAASGYALDNAGVPAESAVWLDQASGLLAKASAALDQVGAGAVLAHLEHVITMVDELRAQPA